MVGDLPDRHPGVDADRLHDGDLHRPPTAESVVAAACRRVDEDPEAPDAGLPVEIRDEPSRLGVLLGDAQVQAAGPKDKAALANLIQIDRVIDCSV